MHKHNLTLLTRADDCGSSIGANEGCFLAARQGIIKNISVMAVGPKVKQAALMMREEDDICYGMHFTINAEWDGVKWKPIAHPSQVPSLLDEHGYFYPNTTFGGNIPCIEEIKCEWFAQLHYLKSLGFPIRYADTHMFPELKIPGLQEAMSAWIQQEQLIDARYFYQPLPLMDDYAYTPGLFEKMVSLFSSGQHYYLCHPAKDTADMLECYNVRNPKGKVQKRRYQELQFVIKPELLQLIKAFDIQLIRYDEADQSLGNKDSLRIWRKQEATRGYEVKAIDATTFLINDFCGNHLYLVEGDRYAALIDTGIGMPGLSKIIAAYTSKPILVFHTHGHFDHVGGSKEFFHCYLSEKDFDVYQQHTTASYRKSYVPHFIEKSGFPLTKEETRSMMEGNAQTIEKQPVNSIINLGNRYLRILATPAHTQGSVCYLEEARQYLFSGDTLVEQGIMLSFPESSSLQEAKEMYQALAKQLPENLKIYGGHHQVPADNAILTSYLTLIAEIEQGKLDGRTEVGTFGEQVVYEGKDCCIILSKRG